MPYGLVPTATDKTMRFTSATVLKVQNGLITGEIGLYDGVTALRQLGHVSAHGNHPLTGRTAVAGPHRRRGIPPPAGRERI